MNRADLYVVQINSDGEGTLRESRPCAHCMAVIKVVGIKRIFYSCRGGGVKMEHVTKETTAEPTYHAKKEKIRVNEERMYRF
jgi:hypothetical protein